MPDLAPSECDVEPIDREGETCVHEQTGSEGGECCDELAGEASVLARVPEAEEN